MRLSPHSIAIAPARPWATWRSTKYSAALDIARPLYTESERFERAFESVTPATFGSVRLQADLLDYAHSEGGLHMSRRIVIASAALWLTACPLVAYAATAS